jgi:osmotically-inducible protein OsmY
MKRWTLPIVAALIAAGCVVKTDQETVDRVEQRASEAGQAAQKTAAEVAATTAKATAQAAQTAKIASALASSQEVEKNRINVDTIDKTIYLKGTVPTRAMKDKAEAIAKTLADPGYKVVSELKVEEQPMDDSVRR